MVEVIKKFNQVIALLEEQNKLRRLSKEVLTLPEAAQYLGISTSTLRHYTADNVITHFKPNNKNIYFHKEDLIAFALQGKVEANATAEQKAINYL